MGAEEPDDERIVRELEGQWHQIECEQRDERRIADNIKIAAMFREKIKKAGHEPVA